MLQEIPFEVFLNVIIPFCSSASELSKLKVVCKEFNNNIFTHKTKYKCYRCGSNRFNISRNCEVENCMVSYIHPLFRFKDGNKIFCSLLCYTNGYRIT